MFKFQVKFIKICFSLTNIWLAKSGAEYFTLAENGNGMVIKVSGRQIHYKWIAIICCIATQSISGGLILCVIIKNSGPDYYAKGMNRRHYQNSF